MKGKIITINRVVLENGKVYESVFNQQSLDVIVSPSGRGEGKMIVDYKDPVTGGRVWCSDYVQVSDSATADQDRAAILQEIETAAR